MDVGGPSATMTPSMAGAVLLSSALSVSPSLDFAIDVVEPVFAPAPPPIPPRRLPAPPSLPTSARKVSQAELQRALGQFRLERKLGQGAMGAVYLAVHEIIGSKVAIKFLKPSFASNLEVVEQFRNEARAVNRVGHPGILRIFDLRFVPPSCHLLLMEYLEGRPLSSLRAPIAAARAIHLLAGICDALEAAHQVGVVHRDIKPDNVFLLRRGQRESVKLLDFGAARLQATGAVLHPTRKRAKLIFGTPAFMPPEQWAGDDIDGRADLYAVGVIAYQLATGRRPFAHKPNDVRAIYEAHLRQVPKDPRELNPRVPGGFAELILRALKKRPEDRFTTAGEMAEALRALVSHRKPKPVLMTAPPTPEPSLCPSWPGADSSQVLHASLVAEPGARVATFGVGMDTDVWTQAYRAYESATFVRS